MSMCPMCEAISADHLTETEDPEAWRVLDILSAHAGGERVVSGPPMNHLCNELGHLIQRRAADAVAADRLHRGWTFDEQEDHQDHDDAIRSAERARIVAGVQDPANWLSACGCTRINPKFGEGLPGGHFSDCSWALEAEVRAAAIAIAKGDAP